MIVIIFIFGRVGRARILRHRGVLEYGASVPSCRHRARRTYRRSRVPRVLPAARANTYVYNCSRPHASRARYSNLEVRNRKLPVGQRGGEDGGEGHGDDDDLEGGNARASPLTTVSLSSSSIIFHCVPAPLFSTTPETTTTGPTARRRRISITIIVTIQYIVIINIIKGTSCTMYVTCTGIATIL